MASVKRIEAHIIAETILDVCNNLSGRRHITPEKVESAFIASCGNYFVDYYWYGRHHGVTEPEPLNSFLKCCIAVAKGEKRVTGRTISIALVDKELRKHQEYISVRMVLKRIVSKGIWKDDPTGFNIACVDDMIE